MRFRCNMPACGSFPKGFEFVDHGGVCPKCGSSGAPLVVALIDVHLMVMDSKGPIQGRMGRQYVACERARAYLCRHPEEPFAATDDPRAVTCPKCVRTGEFRAEASAYEELAQMVSDSLPTVTVADMGATRDAPARK